MADGLIVAASEIAHLALDDPRTRPLSDEPECFMCGFCIACASLGVTISVADAMPLHAHTRCCGDDDVELFSRYTIAVNAVVARTLEPHFDWKPRVIGGFA